MKSIHIPLTALFMVLLIASFSVVHAEQLNLVHDANGNLVSGDGLYREYNNFNQLVRIRNGSNSSSPTLEEYVYHPTQERVLIKDVFNNSGEVAESVYYISDEFVRVVNRTGTYDTVYVHVDEQLVAQKNADGSKFFVHADHLGSASVVTDSSGNAIENTSYEPFGGIVSGGQKTRFDYEGKEFDSVVGDYDFHFRKYIPGIGWIQPDTLIQNVYDPQSLNRYSFERNNPYRNTDPTGHNPIAFIGAVVRTVASAVAGAAVGYLIGSAAGAVLEATSQFIDNYQAQKSGGVVEKSKIAARNIDAASVRSAGHNLGKQAAVAMGIQGLAIGASLNFRGLGKTNIPQISQSNAGQALSGQLKTYLDSQKTGYTFSPHAIGRAAEHLESGAIKSQQSIVNALKYGKDYYDPLPQNVPNIKYYGGVRVAYDNANYVATITPGDLPPRMIPK